MTGRSKDNGSPVAFSVLIALVSTEDRERVFETLQSLHQQRGDNSYEVVVADRRNDAVSARIAESYPEVRLIACASDTSIPELRAVALDQAVGTYVAVIEDHCIPSPNWLSALDAAFREAPENTAAVGGCVENGVQDTGFDQATFLCEYSALLAPVSEGETASLPGMNVAYRRSVLAGLDRDLLTKGFWETTIHPALIHRGMKLYSSNRIVIRHSKKFSRRLFASQRFLYSRYFAGIRFERHQYMARTAACVLSVLLPIVLLYRICRNVWSKGGHRVELALALPSLVFFVTIWGLGEMVGYIFGSGSALSRIE